MEALGHRRWAIAEGYIPSQSSFSEPSLVSHETACILNCGERTAEVRITIFFADREPVGPYLVTVAARRTLHLRFNDLHDPEPIPRDTAYSSVFEFDRADRCAAHKIGLATARSKPALDHRFCGNVNYEAARWRNVASKTLHFLNTSTNSNRFP